MSDTLTHEATAEKTVKHKVPLDDPSRVRFEIQGGKMKLSQGGEAKGEYDLNELRGMVNADQAKSTARERLERLKAQRGDIIEPVTIEGETWFIKRLSWDGLIEISSLVAQLGRAPSHTTLMRDNIIAMLARCVVTDNSAEAQPYFELDFTPDGNPTGTAVEFADEPMAAIAVNELFDHCVRLSPHLFPKATGTASGATSVPTRSEPTNWPESSATSNTTAPALPSS